jgi:hypothetical protein
VELGALLTNFALTPTGITVVRLAEGGIVCVGPGGEPISRTLEGRRFGDPVLDYSGALVLPSSSDSTLVVLPPLQLDEPVLGWPVSVAAGPVTVLVDPHVCTSIGVDGEVDELRLIPS